MTTMSQRIAPVPVRDGLAPSFLHLPAGPWPSLLSFLVERFPHIDTATWRQRLQSGQVFDHAGQPHTVDSPYPANRRIWYYRDVPSEVPVPFDAPLLYRDPRLVVADKPHFLASVPGGRHVHETLLTRLRNTLATPALTAVHRLDRETAGVILYCADPTYRGAYQTLFQARAVSKEYEAIGRFNPTLALPHCRRSRLLELPGSFLMREVPGEANSETEIALIERRGAWARYRLRPATGKKHQLRAHLAALGLGIYADPWYPALLPDKAADDFGQPLRLLARAIAFTDPVDGTPRRYVSTRTLAWPDEVAG